MRMNCPNCHADAGLPPYTCASCSTVVTVCRTCHGDGVITHAPRRSTARVWIVLLPILLTFGSTATTPAAMGRSSDGPAAIRHANVMRSDQECAVAVRAVPQLSRRRTEGRHR